MANYRGAVIGCGRIGSTIDDEHIDRPQFRYPWAHAPAIIEAQGVDLVAAQLEVAQGRPLPWKQADLVARRDRHLESQVALSYLAESLGQA